MRIRYDQNGRVLIEASADEVQQILLDRPIATDLTGRHTLKLNWESLVIRRTPGQEFSFVVELLQPMLCSPMTIQDGAVKPCR